MKDKRRQHKHTEPRETCAVSAANKKTWQDPKLAFVQPKLTKHGSVKELTGGFFGTFNP